MLARDLLLASATACLGLACFSRPPATPEELEQVLREGSPTVVRAEHVVLFSPYDAETTEPYTRVVGDEARRVGTLFQDSLAEPARVYLVPVESDDPSIGTDLWRQAHAGGREGLAFDAGFVCVYVPVGATSSQAFVRAWMGAETIRHELVHFYARRAGLQRAAWFHEGLATLVADGSWEDGAFVVHPFPRALLDARTSAAPGTLAGLLAWRRGEEAPLAEMQRRYALAEAFVRFLRELEPGAPFVEGLRAILALEDAALLALEPEWLAWLARQDALEAVRRGLQSPAPAERARAAQLLPTLAEAGAPELATRAADELALERLDDPASCAPAVFFLAFFRVRQLGEADLARLETSPAPARRLVARLLRARRGEPFELERARADGQALPEDLRAALEEPLALIPGLRRP